MNNILKYPSVNLVSGVSIEAGGFLFFNRIINF